MVASESLARVEPGTESVAGCLALSNASRWNQTADDWRVFMQGGQTFGMADEEGALVATAAALPYAGVDGSRHGGASLGWIAMVLVHEDWRQRGLATQLMQDCIDALQARGAVPVLDATPAGAPVYRRIGFRDGFALTRWEGSAVAAGVPGNEGHGRARAVMLASAPRDVEAIVALDADATGIDRRVLIADFLQRKATQAAMSQDGSGFVIARAGTRATQIGPLVAADETAALGLLQMALSQAEGRVFLDLPDRWTVLSAWLESHGFTRQRPFIRMALDSACVAEISEPHEHQFVLAGPEFG